MKKERTPGSHAPKREKPPKPPREPKPPKAAGQLLRREADGPAAIFTRVTGKKNKKRRRMAMAIFLISVLIIAVAAVLIGDLDKRDYDGIMAQALASYRAGDYDSALSYLRRAENISHSDECLMLMADCYEAQGNLELALETLRRLDTSNSAIAQRIAELERQRLQLLDEERLIIAGRQVPKDITSLVLDGLGVTDEDLSALVELRGLSELSLENNKITDIGALSALGGLITLNLSGNEIEDLTVLGSLTGLRTLYLDDNPIQDLSPLHSLTGLATLSITGLALDKGQLEALSAALPNCAIHSETKAVTDITIGGIRFQSDVERLDLSGLGLQDISVLKSCANLRQLNLSGNAIGDLSPLMNLPVLERLNVSDNNLTDLRPLIGMGTLRKVDASHNAVTDTAAVGAMTGLTELNLSDNPLTDFSGLEKLRNLWTLRLKNTGITDEDLSYLYRLDTMLLLELDDNTLSGEAVDALQKAIPTCSISHSELVYSVRIGEVSVPGDTEELRLSGCALEDISGLTGLFNLRTVDLSRNRISNIYILQYTKSRFTIQSLDLSDNAIEDITPVSGLTALAHLDLSNNRIASITPLMEMKGLESLDLSGNLLSEEQLEALRAALPDCAIKAD